MLKNVISNQNISKAQNLRPISEAEKLARKWSSTMKEFDSSLDFISSKDYSDSDKIKLGQLLENEKVYLNKVRQETDLNAFRSKFMGLTPEQCMKVVVLYNKNSIRSSAITEFPMKSFRDSIKFIQPVYEEEAYGQDDITMSVLKGSFTDEYSHDSLDPYNFDKSKVMYEKSSPNYSNEFLNGNVILNGISNNIRFGYAVGTTIDTNSGEKFFGENGKNYIDGYSKIFLSIKDDKHNKLVAFESRPLAVQSESGDWYGGTIITIPNVTVRSTGATEDELVKFKLLADPTTGELVKKGATSYEFTGITLHCDNASLDANGELVYSATGSDIDLTKAKTCGITAKGRFNSEIDQQGNALGVVKLDMKSYEFIPKIKSLAIKWTNYAEYAFEDSFSTNLKDVLVQSASQQIRQACDYEFALTASSLQQTLSSHNLCEWNAASGDAYTEYYHRKQQRFYEAIDVIKNKIYDVFQRGGVTSMLVGPMAGTYIKGVDDFEYKTSGENTVEDGAFELGTIGKKIRVFQLPSKYVGGSNECVTLWKNPIENNDVTMACGVRYPLVSTGDIQRVNGYKEMGLARFEDLKCFMPGYLGRISISNIAVNDAVFN